jgi:hypothetical protein
MKRTIQFTPSIKTEWAGTFDYISDSEKIEIMNAMFGYPDVECKSNFWLKTIKPEFDRQLSDFQDYCDLQSKKALKRWERKDIPQDATGMPRDAVGMPSKIRQDNIRQDNIKQDNIKQDNINKGGVGGNKVFTPPTIEQVLEFTKERQCTEQTGRKFYDYYTTQGWKDSSGKPVRNWKGKYIAVWDKPENKNPSATFTAWKDCKF